MDALDAFGREPIEICRALQRAGYDAVVVGGAVRGHLRGEAPSGVELATSAAPDDLRRILGPTFAQGAGETHDTRGGIADSREVHEITTYRVALETDGRHAEVAFARALAGDLLRRDFTINAIAIRPRDDGSGQIVDPFGGRADLENGLIRAVGDPEARFSEDPLRVLRGYRFAARFGFRIDGATRQAMIEAAPQLATIGAERIRDELTKLARQASGGHRLAEVLTAMADDGVLRVFLPELAACRGVTQNEHHAFDVLEHLVRAAGLAAERSPDPRKFFAALLHDIGKPATRSVESDGRVRFLGHEGVGARIAADVLARMGFASADREWIVEAVRQHMRLMHAEPAIKGLVRAGRRALARIEADLEHLSVEDLLELRIADKSASGVAGKELTPEFVARVRALLGQLRESRTASQIARQPGVADDATSGC